MTTGYYVNGFDSFDLTHCIVIPASNSWAKPKSMRVTEFHELLLSGLNMMFAGEMSIWQMLLLV